MLAYPQTVGGASG